MKIIDPGHIYDLWQLGGGEQRITFVKRSGGAVQYDAEWPGVQTQEVLRALIDRSLYLDTVLPCAETQRAVQHLRMALYEYEKRAYRRKKEGVNLTQKTHDDSEVNGVPFTEKDIESRPIGDDGHIIV